MIELVAHGFLAGYAPVQDSLVQDDPQQRRGLLVQDRLSF
jgi:hypothetical protein